MESKELFDEASLLIEKLRKSRNRTDKPTLTNQQRQEILNRIYDGALFWLEASVIQGQTKGVGAATQILERSRMESIELERTGFGNVTENEDDDLTIGYYVPPASVQPDA